jgi:hypothetical protein
MTHVSPTASSTRRRRLVVLLVALAMLLAWVGLDLWVGRTADATFARLQARYGPLDGQSIVAPHVPDKDNRALAVRAAALLTLPAGYDAGLSVALARFRNQDDSSPVPQEIGALAESNSEAIRIAELALDRRESSWDADYAGGGNLPPWFAVRRLSESLYTAARLDIRAGRSDDASRRIAVGLAVSASIKQEPSLLAQLIRIATATEHCEAIKRLIGSGDPSKDALARLAASLDDNRQPDPMQVALVAELRYDNGALTKMERGSSPDDFGVLGMSFWGRLGPIGRPFIRLARVESMRQLERLLAIQAGPRPRAPVQSSPPRFWSPRRRAFVVGQELLRAIDSGDTFNSVLGTTQIGVALRRYRLDRGEYPADLAALVPAYLERLPIDAATGQPPVYARRGAGFTLKSQGAFTSALANSALDWNVPR